MKYENGTDQTLWTVPALFHVTRYMNDARFSVGGRTRVEDRRLGLRQNNVVFETTIYSIDPLEYADDNIINLNVFRNIFIWENFMPTTV